ncbi:stimulator of interferon genes protein [Bombina bombina]|uniref:stimulator of interferon genes protein n=1 Tax=Bombina bombina TaxID=8345 RepID=UPI00235AFA5A|nr:stimulator of interferon genes protein [Bombina bombina]
MLPRRLNVEVENSKIIPQPRGHFASAAALIFFLICVISLYIFGTEEYTVMHILSRIIENFAIVFFGHTATSICECFEEFRHVNTRYNGKYLKAMKASFNPKYFIFFIPVCLIVYQMEFSESIKVALKVLSYVLAFLFGLQAPAPATISEITEKRKMNVAHGLAWSYFVGYLSFILPNLKNSVKTFNEENNNLLKSPEMCKLLILIPLSCRLCDDLNGADDYINFEKELPPLYKDRAGIKERVFKNNVYRILDDEHRAHYCIVEYATPLYTLYQMSDTSSAAFSSEDRVEQAKLFYRTLRDILEKSTECQNTYRLVIYDDSQMDEGQEQHILSKEILNHLNQQNSEEYYLGHRKE